MRHISHQPPAKRTFYFGRRKKNKRQRIKETKDPAHETHLTVSRVYFLSSSKTGRLTLDTGNLRVQVCTSHISRSGPHLHMIWRECESTYNQFAGEWISACYFVWEATLSSTGKRAKQVNRSHFIFLELAGEAKNLVRKEGRVKICCFSWAQ